MVIENRSLTFWAHGKIPSQSSICHREVFAEADKDRNGVLSEEESILFFKSLVKIQKFNKILEKTEDLLQKREGFFVTGHHVVKRGGLMSRNPCNSSQTFSKWRTYFFRRIWTPACSGRVLLKVASSKLQELTSIILYPLYNPSDFWN